MVVSDERRADVEKDDHAHRGKGDGRIGDGSADGSARKKLGLKLHGAAFNRLFSKIEIKTDLTSYL
jgi:hypothetical protein